MNALVQLKPSVTKAPKAKASHLLEIVREIEKAAEDSAIKISEIEKRGWLKNLVTSGRDDLLSTARFQGRINDLLVRLNQEAISLSTLGYVYLASVIAEFERQVNEGAKGSDGRIHVLSENGKRVAGMAKEMFSAILETSRSTQEKIDANAEAVEALRADVDDLFASDLSNQDSLGRLSEQTAHQTNHAADLAASNAREFKRLEGGIESVAAFAVAVEGRITSSELALCETNALLEKHLGLTEKNSDFIAQADSSIHALQLLQHETNLRVEELLTRYQAVEERQLALYQQNADLKAQRESNEASLRRIIWAMGAAILFVSGIAVFLALQTLNLV
jgi:hypothetical protein